MYEGLQWSYVCRIVPDQWFSAVPSHQALSQNVTMTSDHHTSRLQHS